MLDFIIRGTSIVTAAGTGAYDIGIQGERIVEIAPMGQLDAVDGTALIDAGDKIVIPGGIDSHVHSKWSMPNGAVSAPPDVMTRAAVFGGTTTVIDFAVWNAGMTLQQAIEKRDGDWHEQAYCDYSYHVLLHGEIPESVLGELPSVVQAGFPSVKMYTTDVRPARVGWKTDHGDIWEVLKVLAKHGGIACVHAEDNDLVMHMYRKLQREKQTSFVNMAMVHSTLSEDLSFRRIIRLAENVEGAALYLMHVSAAKGVEAILDSRRNGFPIYGETLHQYTLFTSEDYRRPNGQIYHTYPSLKAAEDCAALWSGLTESGAISTVSTDGVCTPFETKISRNQIDDTTGGGVGLEPRVSIMYTEMVAKRGCSLDRFVQVVSTNAAKIMGLYPERGAIAAGSFADIAILEPGRKVIRAEDLHESDYTPWEGYEAAVWPCMTFVRGRKVMENGRLLGKPGIGRRANRRIADAMFERAAC